MFPESELDRCHRCERPVSELFASGITIASVLDEVGQLETICLRCLEPDEMPEELKEKYPA